MGHVPWLCWLSPIHIGWYFISSGEVSKAFLFFFQQIKLFLMLLSNFHLYGMHIFVVWWFLMLRCMFFVICPTGWRLHRYLPEPHLGGSPSRCLAPATGPALRSNSAAWRGMAVAVRKSIDRPCGNHQLDRFGNLGHEPIWGIRYDIFWGFSHIQCGANYRWI